MFARVLRVFEKFLKKSFEKIFWKKFWIIFDLMCFGVIDRGQCFDDVFRFLCVQVYGCLLLMCSGVWCMVYGLMCFINVFRCVLVCSFSPTVYCILSVCCLSVVCLLSVCLSVVCLSVMCSDVFMCILHSCFNLSVYVYICLYLMCSGAFWCVRLMCSDVFRRFHLLQFLFKSCFRSSVSLSAPQIVTASNVPF